MSAPFTDLREVSSARISCDETVLQCTGRNQPICSSRAMPSASRRSVLIGIAFSAALTCRVSISTASKPASVRPLCSQCDRGPASRPITAIPCGSSFMNATSDRVRWQPAPRSRSSPSRQERRSPWLPAIRRDRCRLPVSLPFQFQEVGRASRQGPREHAASVRATTPNLRHRHKPKCHRSGAEPHYGICLAARRAEHP